MALKFRKKPVVIEATQWTGDNFDSLWLWGGGLNEGENLNRDAKILLYGSGEDSYNRLTVETLEGSMTASVGDWIIKGIKGEFYPCKPDIFEATYEPVSQ